MGQFVRPLTWQEVVKAAKSGKKRLNVGGVSGLYAECRSFNPKRPSPHGITFFMRYVNQDGERKTLTLPKNISLSEARTQALDVRSLIDNGQDPLEKRKKDLEEAKKADEKQKEEDEANKYTFRVAAEEYIGTKPWQWKIKGKAEKKMRAMVEKHIYPSLGDIPLKDITPFQIATVLNTVFKQSFNVGRKVKAFINHTFREAMRLGKVKGLKSPFGEELNLLISGNQAPVAKSNLGALPHQQIPSFIEALMRDSIFSSSARQAIVFSIGTAARSQAVRYMKWQEVDLVKRTWTIPIENDKMKGMYRNRTIYLSTKICEFLRRIPRIVGCDYVFPSRITLKPLDENALSVTIRKMHNRKKAVDGIGWVDPVLKDKNGNPKMVTQHGCARAGFKTWAVDDENGNFAKYPPSASEYCLLHSTEDPYKGAYDRSRLEKSCRELMEAWGEYCFKGIDFDKYLPLPDLKKP